MNRSRGERQCVDGALLWWFTVASTAGALCPQWHGAIYGRGHGVHCAACKRGRRPPSLTGLADEPGDVAEDQADRAAGRVKPKATVEMEHDTRKSRNHSFKGGHESLRPSCQQANAKVLSLPLDQFACYTEWRRRISRRVRCTGGRRCGVAGDRFRGSQHEGCWQMCSEQQ